MMKTENEILTMVRKVVHEINQVPLEKRKDFMKEVETAFRDIVVADGEKIDGLVYITHDLTQFKDIAGNRLINDNTIQIKKLADSIREQGNIVPVVKNRQEQLIDGQRRIAAIRRYALNTPVRYIYHEDADIDTVSTVNQHQVKWNYRDWLHKYSATDHKDYKDYETIATKYEKYMRSRSLRGVLMNGKADALPLEIWEGGKFTIDREKLSFNVNYLELLKKVFEIGEKENIFARDRQFQKALYEVMKNTKKIDAERLLYKIRYGYNRLNIKTDYKTYRRLLAELYNVRLSGDKHHVTEDEGKKPEENGAEQPELNLTE